MNSPTSNESNSTQAPGGLAPDSIAATARLYVAGGLSVIPIKADGSKAPTLIWKPYQQRPMAPDEINEHFSRKVGIAVVCGHVSGGLEGLDFDMPGIFEKWSAIVKNVMPGLLERLPCYATPCGGAHVYYRSSPIPGNQKLAEERFVDEKTGKTTYETLIETRGEGGYVIEAPSPACCHPTNRNYRHLAGPMLPDVPVISPVERDILISVARCFDKKQRRVETGGIRESMTAPPDSRLPGTDYNLKADWKDILPPHGWEIDRQTDGVTYWKRPGKNGPGCSATTGHCGNKLYVFSSNAHPFEPGTAYTKFAAYAFLNHGGDFPASARALSKLGYGDCKREVFGADEIWLTDVGNAKRLVAGHGKDLRYCYPQKKWYAWDGIRWTHDETGEVERHAKETVRSIYKEAASQTDDAKRIELAKHATRCESESKIKAMIESAKSEAGIPVLPKDFDVNPLLLNCMNGTVNLQTGAFREARREDMISKMAPVKYDPEAKAPLWENFLNQITNNNANLVAYLRRAVGYALTGSTQEHALFFLYGSGRNGKSTFLAIIQSLLGEGYSRQIASEILLAKRNDSHPTGITDLFGARFVSTVEIEDGRNLAESLVKQLTGGDKIRARRMHEDFWEFEPTHKIFLAANHKPIIRGTDSAIWSRICLIPFTVFFSAEKQDKNLLAKLRGELPGILNWALRGCREWQEIGLSAPPEVVVATEEYRGEMDTVAEFLSDRCILMPDAKISSAQLYDEYKEWSRTAEGGEPLSKKAFAQRLYGKNLQNSKQAGRKWWFGVKLIMPEFPTGIPQKQALSISPALTNNMCN